MRSFSVSVGSSCIDDVITEGEGSRPTYPGLLVAVGLHENQMSGRQIEGSHRGIFGIVAIYHPHILHLHKQKKERE